MWNNYKFFLETNTYYKVRLSKPPAHSTQPVEPDLLDPTTLTVDNGSPPSKTDVSRLSDGSYPPISTSA